MTNEIKDGGPAFPHHDGSFGGAMDSGSHGVSVRDYFAAKAMQGLILNETDTDFSEENVEDGLAELSYRIASAMLKAREHHD